MVYIREIELNSLTWAKGAIARFWFVQPQFDVALGPPLVPARRGETPGLRLLRATLRAENNFPAPIDAPALILLPELSIHPEEIPTAVTLAQTSRRNTVVIFGVGQLTEDQARRLEPAAELWEGPSEQRFTNCAVVILGGTQELYLQPKIVRSRWETSHWPGSIVRYFHGQRIQFIVVICSELIDRPQGANTAVAVVEQLAERGRTLNLMIWIQHNPRPRSEDFVESIETFSDLRTTIAIVGSRTNRSAVRLNNHAVSGAIVPHDSLSSHFDLFTKRFHYVEPVPCQKPISRAVLLRYDADAYRVQTVLADSITRTEAGTAKGALLEDSQPYVLLGDELQISNADFHLRDIAARATLHATNAIPVLTAQIANAVDAVCDLGTPAFLAFLDVGVIPRPPHEDDRHVAGVVHPGGDFKCCCWDHRTCVDRLSDRDDCAAPLAQILLALAALTASGVEVAPCYNTEERTNVRLGIDGRVKQLAVVYPFNLDAEGTELGLWGLRRASTVSSQYIILGAGERPTRPRLNSVSAAVVRPLGGTEAALPTRPVINALYSNDFWQSFHQGILKRVIRERFFREETAPAP